MLLQLATILSSHCIVNKMCLIILLANQDRKVCFCSDGTLWRGNMPQGHKATSRYELP